MLLTLRCPVGLGSRKTLVGWIALLVFIPDVTTSAWAQCRSCASELSLTRRDWACLEQKLEGYLSEKFDPVVVSLFNCNDRIADSVRAPIMQKIAPGRAAGADGKSDSVFILSKSQLACIKSGLPRIKAQPNEPITLLFRECVP